MSYGLPKERRIDITVSPLLFAGNFPRRALSTSESVHANLILSWLKLSRLKRRGASMKVLRMIVLMIVVLPLCAFAEQPRTLQLRIAGGETVTLPVTDGGPLPAENKAFKIEAAGPAVQPSDTDPDKPMVKWGFMLTVKSAQTLERVVVEQVYPNESVEGLIDDQAPALRGRHWSGSSSGVGPDSNSLSWLFSDRTTLFVFRFRISAVNQPSAVLYQATAFSAPAKEVLRNAIFRPLSRFDGRLWTIGNNFADERLHITEYVLPPEHVDSWSELMTHQVFVDRSNHISVQAFVNLLQQALRTDCKDFRWTLLEQSDSGVLYEWSHGECANSFAQYEMGRIALCRIGVSRWAYATRHVPVNTKQADEWALILKKLDPEE